MAYKQKKSMIAGTGPVKRAKEAKIKEIKGTSIFGKSPKEFVKSAGRLALDVAAPGLSQAVRKGKEAYKGYKKALKTGWDTGENAEKLVAKKRAVRKGAEEGARGGVAEKLTKKGKKKGMLMDSHKKAKRKLTNAQSRKDRLDYQSGGMGDGSKK